MVIEIILVLFAILYYLFSIVLFATYIQDVNKTDTISKVIAMSIITMVISPIAVPIILGIELGEWVKNN